MPRACSHQSFGETGMLNFINSNTLVSGIHGVMSRGFTKENFVAGGVHYNRLRNQHCYTQRLINWVEECVSSCCYSENARLKMRTDAEKFRHDGFFIVAEAILKFDRYKAQSVDFNIAGHNFKLTVAENSSGEIRLKINASMLDYSYSNIKSAILQAYLLVHRNPMRQQRISLTAFNFDGVFMCGVDLSNCDLPDLDHTVLTGATLNQTRFGKVDCCTLDDEAGIESYKASQDYTRQLRKAAIQTALSELALPGYDSHLSALIVDYDHAGASIDACADQSLINMLASDDAILKLGWIFSVNQAELFRIEEQMDKLGLILDLSNIAGQRYWRWKFQKKALGLHSGLRPGLL